MADVTVTNTTIEDVFSPAEITLNASTEDTAGGAQKFVITPTRSDLEGLLLVDISGATLNKGDVTVAFSTGVQFGGRIVTGATVKEGTIAAFKLDSAAIKTSGGTFEITLDPATATSKLTTDLSAKVAYIEDARTL